VGLSGVTCPLNSNICSDRSGGVTAVCGQMQNHAQFTNGQWTCASNTIAIVSLIL